MKKLQFMSQETKKKREIKSLSEAEFQILVSKFRREDFSLITEKTIESVEETAWELIRGRYKWFFVGFIVLFIVYLIGAAWYGYNNNLRGAVESLILPIFFAILIYKWLYNRVHKSFMYQFAKANGYEFDAKGVVHDNDGVVFSIGRRRSASNVVRGELLDYPLTLFNYSYQIGSGDMARDFELTVFRIQFPFFLPGIFLRRRKHKFAKGGFNQPIRRTYVENVPLLGNLEDFFQLSAAKEHEIEALQIFTPHFLESLRDNWLDSSLEFVNNHLYIYTAHKISKRSELLQMYQLARLAILQLTPVLERMEKSVKAMRSVAELKKILS